MEAGNQLQRLLTASRARALDPSPPQIIASCFARITSAHVTQRSSCYITRPPKIYPREPICCISFSQSVRTLSQIITSLFVCSDSPPQIVTAADRSHRWARSSRRCHQRRHRGEWWVVAGASRGIGEQYVAQVGGGVTHPLLSCHKHGHSHVSQQCTSRRFRQCETVDLRHTGVTPHGSNHAA